MTKGPINPVTVAKEAIALGLLKVGDVLHEVKSGDVVHVPLSKDGSIPMLTFFNGGGGVRLPSEVGLQRINPTPPAPSSKLLLRKKRVVGNKKWIVTRKTRPDLYP